MTRLKANYTILAIETSLDDTCAAVTVDDRVVSNVVASQVKFHEEYGGTVPHIAKRKHREWIDRTIDEALRLRSGRHQKITDVDAVAVTYGPGLAPCLEVGIAKAKELAREWQKPLIAVNHMEGHLLSSLAKNRQGKNKIQDLPEIRDQMPVLGFLISGGHTELVLMRGLGKYELLGETLDDAAGEAYDKVARMLNLGYPGGPILSELAKEGDPSRYPLPEPMKHRQDLNFSFSGIKTAALYKLRDLYQIRDLNNRQFVADFAASFQQAVLKMLRRKFKRALEMYQPKMVLLGGGVVSNVAIRTEARKVANKFGVPVVIPYSPKLFTDNAAMIGVCAWYQAQRGEFVEDLGQLDRQPNLSFRTKS
ncbi:tRNA (adenosine(37)-N6)-threonylcarbamoyltransferase complex transferase subunit TsaD [Microgenomates group bacterium RBG_16_45_19]|nr:MAG: tRNA (adenosine(37)-N6)-threonylcarbamoyltransferase complex transferase subunit TsaD [Microgenomates group bacterium RBG_16_45_19]